MLATGRAKQRSAAEPTFEIDIGFADWNFGEAEALRVTQPALVVLGGNSPNLHPRFKETYRLLEWLPNAEGLVIPGATHFLHLESADIPADLRST